MGFWFHSETLKIDGPKLHPGTCLEKFLDLIFLATHFHRLQMCLQDFTKGRDETLHTIVSIGVLGRQQNDRGFQILTQLTNLRKHPLMVYKTK